MLYRFIGSTDPALSMNLVKGQVYSIKVSSQRGLAGELIVEIVYHLSPDFPETFWQCPYDNFDKFRENWEPVE